MSNPSPAPAAPDLSALAWVAGELQRSLETAHKALRRFLKEAQSTRDSDVDVADPATLRAARVQFHQSVGALELVDLPIPARVLRSSEAAVQRMIGKPALVTEEAVDAIERASFAVIDYLQRTLAGRPVTGVALFPQYREVQVLAGGDRIHPADLWGQQWRWQTLPEEPGVVGRPSDDDARDAMERLVLALMRRAAPDSHGRMSDFCAELGAGARSSFASTVWRLAAAFFDAQAAGLLDSDVYAKRMASRLLAQLRASVQRHDEVSERLAADLLFFCARAQSPQPGQAPRLQNVREAWGLGDTAPATDYQTPRLGRFDPAMVAQARKRIATAKDAWSVVAGGESRRSTGLVEPFSLLADSLRQLLPDGEVLAQALQTVAAQVQNAGAAPTDALAMEMATAMLWLDAVVEEGELDAPELAERTRLVARRVDLAREGGGMQPLEPWIEQLYRRVSDQQTMGSVVQELRSALTEVEKQIDQYFRDPSQREVLVPVPAQLSSMRGVLSVLDLDQASQAVVHMRNAVDELASTEVDASRAREVGTFDRLADNLGALGFLIDMLSVQPGLARSLFHFEPETGRLLAATGAPSRLTLPDVPLVPALSDEARQLAQVAVQAGVSDEELSRQLEDLTRRAVVDDQAGLARVAADAQQALEGARDDTERAAARAGLAQAVTELVSPVPVPELPVSAPVPPARETPTVPGGTGLEDDDEMRDIFIEEAREVIATARESLQRLAANSEDVAEITVVRRSFHTLKGSSRMVGLRDFGEAAWACEQVYNARLAENPRLDPELSDFTHGALNQLAEWVEVLDRAEPALFDPLPWVRRGEALRGVAPSPVAAPQPVVPVAAVPLIEAVEAVESIDTVEIIETSPATETATILPEAPAQGSPLQEASAWPDLQDTMPVDLEPTPVLDSLPVPTIEPVEAPSAEVDFAADSRVEEVPLQVPIDVAAAPELPELDADAEPSGAAFPELALDVPSPDAASEPRFEPPLESAPESAPVSAPVGTMGLVLDFEPEIQPLAPDDAFLLPVAEVVEASTETPSDSPVQALLDGSMPASPAASLDTLEKAATEAALPDPLSDPALPEPLSLESLPLEPDAVVAEADELLPVAFVDESTPQDQMTSHGESTFGTLPSLSDRVPDLPSASDLDLGGIALPEVTPEPLGVDVLDAGLGADLVLDGDTGTAAQARTEVDSALIDGDGEPLEPFALQESLEPHPAPAESTEPPMAWSVDLQALDAPVVAAGDAEVRSDVESEQDADEVPTAWAPPDASMAEPPQASAPVVEPVPEPVTEDPVKVVGPLRIPIPLFNIFLNEADEQSRRLVTDVAEWGLEWSSRPVQESTVALAHSLAGNSATVGYAELSSLARALEHALSRSAQQGRGREGEPALFAEAADEIRRLLHQFAAGFLKPVPTALMARLADHEHWSTVEMLPLALDPESAHDLMAPAELPRGVTTLTLDETSIVPATEDEDDLESTDSIDHDLLPIFAEEAEDLLPKLQSQLADWARHPQARQAPEACLRTLHTFKGGARLAGAMRVGELAHRLETDIEDLLAHEAPTADGLDRLQHRLDRMASLFEATCRAAQGGEPVPTSPGHVVQPVPADVSAVPETVVSVASPQVPQLPQVETSDAPDATAAEAPVERPVTEPELQSAAPVDLQQDPLLGAQPEAQPESQGDEPADEPADVQPEPQGTLAPAAEPLASVDWSRFTAQGPDTVAAAPVGAGPGTSGVVRVRTGLLDRLVNSAGEVSIARSRIESDVRTLQGSLEELTGSLERMRRELRDIEVQAESQIASRIEAAKASAQAFDPLEMDRFTRLQELTRMMAESVNDVATLQRSLQRTLQSTEDQLASQSRLTRELQDDLLRTRMVEFESLADRLYRVVRQAAKDLGKQVRLEITGGSIEVDRGVLERMVGPFEHMLRNSVVHGIESPGERSAAGKDPTGTIRVTVSQVGNEVGVEFGDDGRGLDLVRIRERAVDRGLLSADAPSSDDELAQLIFVPGFSTAGTVSELAGRGIGMDVVRSEVNAMGGRIETHSTPQQGVRFRLVLPLTTAVTQVVLLGAGALTVAVPSSLVQVVRRVPVDELQQAYEQGSLALGDASVPFFWLPELLDGSGRGPLEGRTQMVVFVQSASQRVALHVQEVLGNQEVVVKNVGPQLSHMPGLAGVTLLPSGAAALIYNPVALAALYGEEIVARRQQAAAEPATETGPAVAPVPEPVVLAPLVMVVDDSLTVRRVTQRLLEREGYRVLLAKDGMDALEKLAEVRPTVMLCDIEMPRMDGFELVRVLRSDPERADIPVVMITSRIAQKHRDHAAQLGVQHYLGKPYPEDRLLALVAEYAAAEATV